MDSGSVELFNEAEYVQIVRNTLNLNSDVDVKLLSSELKPGSNELVGFMGEYYELEIHLVDESVNTGERVLMYFVKSVPILNEYYKSECERKGFFKKETHVYTDILTNIQRFAISKLCPSCYYTRADLLVLEDLGKSPEGLRHRTKVETATKAHHEMVLRHLAKLHAASLAWEADEQFNIGERFKDVLIEIQLTTRNEWYVTGIKGVVFLAKMHDKFQTPELQSFMDNKLFAILSNLEILTKPSKKLRNVFCHGDSWDRNIFYKHDENGVPIDCRIVDFQLARYSPPALDVLFFLYVNTSPELRPQVYDEYLEFYYKALQENLKLVNLSENLIPKEDFLLGCRYARLAIITLWAICEPLMKMPEGLSSKMRAEEQAKFDEYMNTERNEFFLRIMELEPTYKDTIMKPIEELVDYIIENENFIDNLLKFEY